MTYDHNAAVETVARALYNADADRHYTEHGGDWPGWDSVDHPGDLVRNQYRERARRAMEPEEVAVEARQSIEVTAETLIPLGSVAEALLVLQNVPVTASLSLRTSGLPHGRISSDDLALMAPRIVARWTESR